MTSLIRYRWASGCLCALAVLVAQRWWRGQLAIQNARFEALALQWDKVDDLRVQETVADMMKTMAKGIASIAERFELAV